MVMSTGYSSREHGFNSQHPCGGSVLTRHVSGMQTCRQAKHPCMQKFKDNINYEGLLLSLPALFQDRGEDR